MLSLFECMTRFSSITLVEKKVNCQLLMLLLIEFSMPQIVKDHS